MTLPHGLQLRLVRAPSFYPLPFVHANDWCGASITRVYQLEWGWLWLQLHVPVRRKESTVGWCVPDFYGRRSRLYRRLWRRRELDHASW
jgi:hypothetical protein